MKDRTRRVAITLALGAAFFPPVGLRAEAPAAPGKAARDYPVQPVPFTAVHFNDAFWAPRIEINRTVTIPVRLREVRGVEARLQLRARGRRPARRGARGQVAARLSVRRHRRLQGDRGRLLHAERPARSEARRVRRRADREDRRRPGEGRLPLHDAHHRPRRTRTPGRARSAGVWRRWTATSSTTSATCTRRRWLITRPPASGRCSTSPCGRRTCSTGRSVRASSRSGRATRSPRWASSSSTA